jgi:hypothetical protein
MVGDLLDNGVDDGLRRAGALVVLDGGAAGLLAGADDLERRKALDLEALAQRLVGVFIAIDAGDLGQALERLGGLFVGGGELLAVAAPGGVEPDMLGGRKWIVGTYSTICMGQ